MSSEDRWEDLARRTAERARRRRELRSPSTGERGAGTAIAGEILALPEGMSSGLRWVVLVVEGDQAVAAPADPSPAVGEGDLAVGPESGAGALTLRAALALEIPLVCLEEGRSVGRLAAEELARALRLRADAESGSLRPGLTAREVEDDLEHQEWLADVVRPAREALLLRARTQCRPEEPSGSSSDSSSGRTETTSASTSPASFEEPANTEPSSERSVNEEERGSKPASGVAGAEEGDNIYDFPSFPRRFSRSSLLAACLAVLVFGLSAWNVSLRQELEGLKNPGPTRVVYVDATTTVRSGDAIRIDGRRPAVFDLRIDEAWRQRPGAKVTVTGPDGVEVFSEPLLPVENPEEAEQFGIILPPDLPPGVYSISFELGSGDGLDPTPRTLFEVTGGNP